MGSCKVPYSFLLLCFFIGSFFVPQCLSIGDDANQTAFLLVNASEALGRPIPETLFGIFFEEINHAGAGGLWAELVSNRGFEAGGPEIPSNIDPWSIIGDEYSSLTLSTERSSCFEHNKVALRMEVLCDTEGTNTCPAGGVGIYNPGFWGMGHGFRSELAEMLADLKPKFIRFPGGSFVEGDWLRNAFRWKATIGPWEERPGHFGDIWMYWTDDGLGYFEFLQLSEDLGALPVWVFNNGISHNDQVSTSSVMPFVQEALDSIEFARGYPNSTWGSMRAAMGHPEPFDLRHVALGNEDCGKKNYRGNYFKFYNAIKKAYPDVKIITNCDRFSQKLDHPADLYDYHVYKSAKDMFSMAHRFDLTSRKGPKAFVSEYAVNGNNAGKGNLLAALAEAAFLIGIEQNSDVVSMASYAPLFVNDNDRRWSPDAVVFNSSQLYGTPSYWAQHFFRESSSATVLHSTLQTNTSTYQLIASAIMWENLGDNKSYLRIKIVNFGNDTVNLKISVDGLEPNSTIQLSGSTKTVLTSSNLMDENSFNEPTKVKPTQSPLENAGKDMDVILLPYSLTSFDLLKGSSDLRTARTDYFSRSSF
ncbi:alpha-L-arabinofuranosidase 1-like isoform X2 [Juglans microcarpa x Juglans regia]|uniref:alpha-L-arabinofuranosidase 1-like isoform X2 n=1 Tax=Juglans microcarpa x Juglans regia TaxID=2249226 RepID=UPI001B7EC2AE|nr:alpha-L-arabinofuranosidase 1-like isoform X2 [Juglans microcarpa x Juglans regia]